MKMNKRKTAIVSLILCLVAIISLGSLAWFTDTDTVDNKLTFDTSFDVDLYETLVDGTKYEENGETVGLIYDNLTPGATLHKDPTVVNKSANAAQYIRLTVTVDKAAEWAAVVKEGSDLTKIFTGFNSSDWTRVDEPVTDEVKDTITYTFYLNSALEPGKTATLFTGVTIPTNTTVEQAQAIGTSYITIKADAIQTTDLGDGVTTAVQAFEKVGV